MGLSTKDLGRMPPLPDLGAHPADDDYAPPLSTVKLPSRGMVYEQTSPLYLCESIDVKAMTAKEEDILSSPALIRKGIVLSTLIRACITNRMVDPDTMLGGDRNAILLAIRVSAYGHEYDVTVPCPKCGEESQHTFDLSRLPLKMLDEQPVGGPGSNEFEFILPSSKRRVTFQFLTAKAIAQLEEEIEESRKARGPNGGPDQAVTMQLMASIKSIEGVDPEKLPRAIVSMQARDSRALRVHIDEIAPGVDMVQEFECPSCGKEGKVDVPIGPEFFWPSLK